MDLIRADVANALPMSLSTQIYTMKVTVNTWNFLLTGFHVDVMAFLLYA